MPPTTTSNIERIVMEGPIGLSMAIVAGVILLLGFGWALWHERRILGQRHTILFWTLRGIALGTVLWMLLAPENIRVETSTTRKVVAVVTDVSGSMLTIDPAGTSDEIRWAAALPSGRDYSVTRAADKSLAAVGMASQYLLKASEAINQRKPESEVVEATSATNRALQRVAVHLEAVCRESASASRAKALASRLIKTLDGSEFESFSQLCEALQKGRTPAQKGWRESLPDLEHRIASLRRSLHELARLVAEDEGKLLAKNDPSLLASVRKSQRIERVSGFVGGLHQSVLKTVRDKADVRFSSFDQSVTLLTDPKSPESSLRKFSIRDKEVTGSALGTNITGLLEQLNLDRQDQPLAAVFVLSDVAHNQMDQTNPREVAATLTSTPVYVVPIGNTQHVRDVLLQSVYAPAVAMRNDDIVIEARVQAYDCEGEICIVKLLQDGEMIDFREVVLDSGFASRTVRFEQQTPTMGLQQFQVAISPLEDELTEENNVREFEVNVTRSDIKVLLADEISRWEYRYLSQLFRRDPKIECDEMLFHPRKQATGRRADSGTFPLTVDEWDKYDVVLLGDLIPENLPVAVQESLIGYLNSRGGTLVMIAGQEAMPHAYVDHPLEDILPVQKLDLSVSQNANRYTFRLTDAGRDHNALMIGDTKESTQIAWDFVNRFAPLHHVSDWRQPRPSAHTLISAVPFGSLDEEADTKASAFLCWQPVGKGRVIYLSGPDTYRLRYLRGDSLHYRFWGQLLRWAVASDLSAGTKFVRVRTDKSRYQKQDDVRITVKLVDSESVPVVADDLEIRVVSENDERSVPLKPLAEIPGEYLAEVRSLSPGEYRVEPVGPTITDLQKDSTSEPASASFAVQADAPLELVDTRCDRALAQQIADITGGQVLPPTAVEEILELTNLEPIVTERIETRPLWLEWKYLWIVFGCLQIEWIIRKWKGLS